MTKESFSKGLDAVGEAVVTHKKALMYIGGAIAVVTIAVTVVKGVKGGIGDFFNPGKKVKGATSFTDQPVDHSKVTISPEQASMYANQLYNAMKNAGTDKNTIKSIFKGLPAENYKMIYNAFKTRSYYVFGSPTISSWIFGYDDLDLNEWLKKEISSSTDYTTYNLLEKVINSAGMAF